MATVDVLGMLDSLDAKTRERVIRGALADALKPHVAALVADIAPTVVREKVAEVVDAALPRYDARDAVRAALDHRVRTHVQTMPMTVSVKVDLGEKP